MNYWNCYCFCSDFYSFHLTNFGLILFIQTAVRDNKDIAKIREVTGIDNTAEIAEAIQRCSNKEGKYDLETVINVLLGHTEMSPDPISATKVNFFSEFVYSNSDSGSFVINQFEKIFVN